MQATKNPLGDVVLTSWDGRDLYLQGRDAVEAFEEGLEEAERADLAEGWPIEFADPGYFPVGEVPYLLSQGRPQDGPLTVDWEAPDGASVYVKGQVVLSSVPGERATLEAVRLAEWLQEDREVRVFGFDGRREALDLTAVWAQTYGPPSARKVAQVLNNLGYGEMGHVPNSAKLLKDLNTHNVWNLEAFNRSGTLHCTNTGEAIRVDPRLEGAIAHLDPELAAGLALIRHLVLRGADLLKWSRLGFQLPAKEGEGAPKVPVYVDALAVDEQLGGSKSTRFVVQVVQRGVGGEDLTAGFFVGRYAGARPDDHRADTRKLFLEAGKLLQGMTDVAWMNHVLQTSETDQWDFDGLNGAARNAWHESAALIRRTGEAILGELSRPRA